MWSLLLLIFVENILMMICVGNVGLVQGSHMKVQSAGDVGTIGALLFCMLVHWEEQKKGDGPPQGELPRGHITLDRDGQVHAKPIG